MNQDIANNVDTMVQLTPVCAEVYDAPCTVCWGRVIYRPGSDPDVCRCDTCGTVYYVMDGFISSIA